ncbi:MAG: N-acetylmuramoyl-L-alanine amidase [Cyanobacteria bacterium SZAS-4]|nr:N-acetylmuramoyl-L-alanine amidase [Cyanobacteria bacterium SZAS-4]
MPQSPPEVKKLLFYDTTLGAVMLIAVSLFLTSTCQAIGRDKITIVLDPGHSGKEIQGVDKRTNLIDHDYPNHPEMEETYRVARAVGARLEKAGYKVIYTKKDVADTVSLRERATVGQESHAALGVSIHNDHGKSYKSFGQVYEQGLGQWRGGTQSRPKAKFENKDIAAVSAAYAKIFARERTKVEQHTVAVTPISFDNRPGIEPGNIPQVMLFAGTEPNAIPWIYNEVGGKNFGSEEERLYAQGIANSIEKCVSNTSKKQ